PSGGPALWAGGSRALCSTGRARPRRSGRTAEGRSSPPGQSPGACANRAGRRWSCAYPNRRMSEDEPRPNANAEVARLFAEIGDILELKGEQPYRYNAYRTAARSVGSARERLDVLFQQGRLRELYGVGSALESKIVEYLTTGQMEFYERMRREFPSALASLLQVPG